MSVRLERLLAPALLLLPSACADDSRQAEIDCQQRLVNVPGNIGPTKAGSGDKPITNRFARLSDGYAGMSLQGCTEAQAYAAKSLSKLAQELADSAGAPEIAALEGSPSLRQNEALSRFMAKFEQFENRRGALRKELDEMKRRRP